MDKKAEKSIILSKLEKLEELDKKNHEVHKKLNTALIRLLDAKNSNSGLKYLDPEFYLNQAAQTITTIEDNCIVIVDNKNEKFIADESNTDSLDVLDKPFKYIDTYNKDVALMRQLQSIFKEVLGEYISYANYLNSINQKKHK